MPDGSKLKVTEQDEAPPQQRARPPVKKPKVFQNVQDLLPPVPKPQKPKNYLDEIRQERRKENKAQNMSSEWEQIKNNKHLDERDKMEMIIKQTHKIENQARLMEQKAQILKQPNINEEVDDLYIQSIKAKIAILDEIQQN